MTETKPFWQSDYFHQIKRNIVRFLLDQRLYIGAGLEFARSLTSFATNKSLLSFAEGGFGILDTITKTVSMSSEDFFNYPNGYKLLVSQLSEQPLYDILIPVLEAYESQVLTFQYQETITCKIYKTPQGLIGKDGRGIWYYFDQNNKEALLKFFMQELFKKLNSNFLSLSEEEQSSASYWRSSSKFFLRAEKLVSIPSAKSKKYTEYIKIANEKGIHRAIIFCGPPGSGKSICAATIVKELNFRTLKFKYETNTNLKAIEFIIDALNIEAIIIDDFDQNEQSNKLLEFLENIHKKLKLNIATVNSLKSFHSAVLRPQRYDLIETIDKLDASAIKSILGRRYKDLGPKVKHFPAAFIKELDDRLTIDPNLNINAAIKELDKRVKEANKRLKSSGD